jgi:hypothetical protein
MRYICSGGVDEYMFKVTQTGNPSIYGTSTAILQSMYFCQLKNDTTVSDLLLRGKKVLLRKSSGDSGEGVAVGTGVLSINFFANPVPNGTNVNATSNYSGCAAGNPDTTVTTFSSVASGSLGTIQQWVCATPPTITLDSTTGGAAGFADVEFSLLNQVITPRAAGKAISSNLTQKPTAAQVFGIAVTKNLRDALQTAEGLTAGDDTEAGMPSLPAQVIAGVFTGNVTDWSLLQGIDSNNNAVPLFSTSTPVFLARRPQGSGTQASISAMFLNSPCVGADKSMLADSGNACGVGATNTLAVNVTQNQGTSDLLGCLKTLNAGGKYGIGFASTSNRPVSNFGATNQSDSNWRWIRVGGWAPTLYNASTGRYPYVTEGVLGWQTASDTTAGLLAPLAGSGSTPAALNVLNEIATQLVQPTVLSVVNGGNATQNYSNPTFYAGALTSGNATDSAGNFYLPTYPMTVTSVNSNPVLAAARSIYGLNSCQPLMLNSNTQQIGKDY